MSSSLLLDLNGIRAKGILFSRQHISRLVRENKFPRPIKVGCNTNAWLESEIDAYIRRRVEERDNTAA